MAQFLSFGHYELYELTPNTSGGGGASAPEPEGPGEWASPHATAAHSPGRSRYGLVIAPLPLLFGLKSESALWPRACPQQFVKLHTPRLKGRWPPNPPSQVARVYPLPDHCPRYCVKPHHAAKGAPSPCSEVFLKGHHTAKTLRLWSPLSSRERGIGGEVQGSLYRRHTRMPRQRPLRKRQYERPACVQ